MKKIFNSIFVIIAAVVAFASCAKEDAIAPGETKKVQFFAENIETKTHFGDKNDENKYPTLWDADDKVKVLLNLESPANIKNLEKTVEIEVSEDSKSARFVADLNSEYEFDSYTFYAVSPSSAFNAKSSKEGRFTVQIPEAQNPQVTSVDKNAQVLYAVSATTDMFPSSVKLNFKHFTAYGKFSLTNLTDKVNTISSVKLSFEEKVVGKWNYFVEDGSIAAKEATCEIVLTPTSTEDIWFACAPVDMSGKTLTLSVTTDKGDLVKNITFPANRKFEAGKIANFTVDMKGIEVAETDEPDQPEESADVWSLVTDVANLVVGDKIVIAAAKEEYALSITQNNNNRASVAIKKENSVIAINDDVQVITIEEGKVENTFAFNVGSGYLYAASGSSNHLKTKVDLDANGSWLIEITTTGVATIKAKGDNTRNWLRFNTSNNPKIFSCYGSGQTDVAIYRLEGGSEEGGETPEVPVEPDTTPSVKLEAEELELTAEESEGTIEVEVKNIASIEVRVLDEEGSQDESDWLLAEYDVTNACITYSASANESEDLRTAYVEVYCLDVAGNEIVAGVNVTQAGVSSEPVGPQVISVAEFLNKSVSAEVLYQLTGVVSNIQNTQYGNFDLTDESGTIYVYGLKENETAGNTTFSNLGLKEGDLVTLIGTRAEYKNSAQVGDAYYVSHLPSAVAPEITVAENKVSISAANGAEIYYTVDGTVPTTNSTKYVSPFAIEEDTEVKAIAVEANKPVSAVSSQVCLYEDPNAGKVETVEASLSFANKAQRTTFTTSQQVWEQNGIRLTNDKSSSTSNVGDYSNPARFYKSSKITIDAPGNIIKIEFVCNSATYATALKDSIKSGDNVTVSGSNVTVVLTTPATSFVISSLTGGQVRMNSLKVTYEN